MRFGAGIEAEPEVDVEPERRVLTSAGWHAARAEREAREADRRSRSDAKHEELSTVRELLSGEYEVESRLSDSRVSLSFEAKRDGKRGTVLVLPVDCDDSDDHSSVFQRMARELRTLEHPGVIAMRDFGVRHGVPYLEYESLEGRTLGEQLSLGPIGRDRGLQIALDLLHTISWIHVEGFTHGGLNPANVVLMRNSEHTRVLGTGVAALVRAAGGEPRKAHADRYVAPEVVRDGRWDGRADLYSVGALLYHMLTDEVPPPPPAVAAFRGNPLLPPDLEPLLIQALAMDPAGRYASAEEMIAEVEHALGARRALSSVRAPLPSERPTVREKRTRPKATYIGLGAAAVAAAALGIWFGLADPRPEAPVADVSVETESTDVAEPTTPQPAAEADVPEPAAPAAVSTVELDELEVTAEVEHDGEGFTLAMPPELEDQWWRINAGERLDRAAINQVYAYARQHPDDPHPHLLLAAAFMDLAWYTDAVERYRTAYSVEPASRHYPRMLEDLMLLTFNGWISDDATYTVEEIFGVEALPAVEAALAAEPADGPRGRLERLRDRLGRRTDHT